MCIAREHTREPRAHRREYIIHSNLYLWPLRSQMAWACATPRVACSLIALSPARRGGARIFLVEVYTEMAPAA